MHILTFTLIDPKINGDWFKLASFVQKQGLQPSTFYQMLPSYGEIQEGAYYVLMFGLIQLLFMWLVPGCIHLGPTVPSDQIQSKRRSLLSAHNRAVGRRRVF